MSLPQAATAPAIPAPVSSGVSNAKLGIWLFLASEVMLFSTLFTSYVVLRMGAASWPRGWEALNVPLATLNTIVLITSSVSMVMAYARAVQRDLPGFRKYMAITIGLAYLFLIFKCYEYGSHFEHNEWPSTSIFHAVYFTLTGLHCLHVIGGIIVNSTLYWMSGKNFDHPLFLGRVEAAGLYWHFVDIVWIFLFPAIYLI
ncbi:MAG: heme-copper oxidase subunit III [Elusimicrobia bacterium]|nr:heme-copper oxidase subunit III [Elusimicrobiota bacterium]MDE2237305.1 heme-copper oxidase subunit III [Elusimicrobiota bacterium]MDE2424952.1 heme-copper oxidase subunit III [Elusimicrobiota bacterium]